MWYLYFIFRNIVILFISKKIHIFRCCEFPIIQYIYGNLNHFTFKIDSCLSINNQMRSIYTTIRTIPSQILSAYWFIDFELKIKIYKKRYYWIYIQKIPWKSKKKVVAFCTNLYLSKDNFWFRLHSNADFIDKVYFLCVYFSRFFFSKR